MIKQSALTSFAVIGGVAVGFLVGFGIGQEVRKNVPGNVTTNFSDGKITIVANVYGALAAGITDYLGR